MSDQTEATVEEVEVEEVETEEVETEDEAEEAVAEEEEVASASDEQADTGVAMDPAEFQVPDNLNAFAEEMTKGLQQAFADFSATQEARFEQLQKQLDEQTAEIAQLKEAESDRIAEKAADTPVASMSGWMAKRIGSVIGTDGARLNGSTERGLYNKSKEAETEPVNTGVAAPPTIAGFINRQRSGQTFIVAGADQTGQ